MNMKTITIKSHNDVLKSFLKRFNLGLVHTEKQIFDSIVSYYLKQNCIFTIADNEPIEVTPQQPQIESDTTNYEIKVDENGEYIEWDNFNLYQKWLVNDSDDNCINHKNRL